MRENTDSSAVTGSSGSQRMSKLKSGAFDSLASMGVMRKDWEQEVEMESETITGHGTSAEEAKVNGILLIFVMIVSCVVGFLAVQMHNIIIEIGSLVGVNQPYGPPYWHILHYFCSFEISSEGKLDPLGTWAAEHSATLAATTAAGETFDFTAAG